MSAPAVNAHNGGWSMKCWSHSKVKDICNFMQKQLCAPSAFTHNGGWSMKCWSDSKLINTCVSHKSNDLHLQSLRTMEDGDGAGLAFGDYNEDDEDDEEFVLSYQELLGMGGRGAWDSQMPGPQLCLRVFIPVLML
eukprot:1154741-Pelagomonas_calceolata.AAC.5